MITEDVWKNIYNTIFSIYLPPDSVVDKVILTKDNKKQEFNSPTEFITYLTLNMDKEIVQKDVKFILKNTDLYNQISEDFNKICLELKNGV